MDKIDEDLATNALSSKYSAAVHVALSVGKKTLNRYYEKTDLSNVYRIAMSTYPFFAYLTFLIPSFYQSFILATSSHISKKRNGRTSGSKQPGSLYAPSLTTHTVVLMDPHWMTRCALPVFLCHSLLISFA